MQVLFKRFAKFKESFVDSGMISENEPPQKTQLWACLDFCQGSVLEYWIDYIV